MIYLSKELIKELDDKDLAVYSALKSIYRTANSETYISVNQICYLLSGDINSTRSVKDKVQSSINHLIETNVIKCIARINKSEFIVDLSNLYFEGDYYVGIELEEIRKLFCIDTRSDKFTMYRCFVNIIGSINIADCVYDDSGNSVNNFVGYMSTTYLAKISGISPRAFFSYVDILAENHLLYIYHHEKKFRNDKGEIRNICNHYGRYKDKYNIIKFALNYEELRE